MHGIFLINTNNEIAFAQFGKHVRIEAFRYVRDARLCVVIHSGGQEELFTTEQPAPVAERLAQECEILVAHIDERGATQCEYAVPIEHTGASSSQT